MLAARTPPASRSGPRSRSDRGLASSRAGALMGGSAPDGLVLGLRAESQLLQDLADDRADHTENDADPEHRPAVHHEPDPADEEPGEDEDDAGPGGRGIAVVSHRGGAPRFGVAVHPPRHIIWVAGGLTVWGRDPRPGRATCRAPPVARPPASPER